MTLYQNNTKNVILLYFTSPASMTLVSLRPNIWILSYKIQIVNRIRVILLYNSKNIFNLSLRVSGTPSWDCTGYKIRKFPYQVRQHVDHQIFQVLLAVRFSFPAQ